MKDQKKITVLVAEDDFLVSDEIKRIVAKIGYTVVGTASDGEQAVEMTNSLKPDVVLMDVRMPKLNGLEATQKIQQLCPTPVVVLTAYETHDLVTKASKMGAGAYLVKPPKSVEMDRAITISIARHDDLMRSNSLNTKLQNEINERKIVEKALQESEKQYHLLFDLLPYGGEVINTSGKIIKYSPSTAFMLGYDTSELIGKHITELLSSESKKIFQHKFSDLLKGKAVSSEIQMICKDGSKLEILRAAQPIINNEEEVEAVIAINVDITERKQSEKIQSVLLNISNAVNTSKSLNDLYKITHQQLGRIIDTTNFYIVNYNEKTGEIISPYFIDEKVNIQPPAHLTDNGFTDYMIRSKKSQLLTEKKREELIEQGEIVKRNWKSKVWLGVPLKIDEKIIGCIAVLSYKNDTFYTEKDLLLLELVSNQIAVAITRKQAEEEIEISSERLKLLNKMIRHDLSNDFAVIQSAVNIYKRDPDIVMINEIENRVNKSIKSIKDFKRYESFINSNSKFRKIEVSKIIKSLFGDYPDIDFSIKGKNTVFADESLSSIFTNLITNSINHGQSTLIKIKILSNKGMCKIKFIDNGKGIPDKIKKMIFDEGFHHGESGHTGIGLYLVKQTIEGYGGSISVEDNLPSGATFIIHLREVY